MRHGHDRRRRDDVAEAGAPAVAVAQESPAHIAQVVDAATADLAASSAEAVLDEAVREDAQPIWMVDLAKASAATKASAAVAEARQPLDPRGITYLDCRSQTGLRQLPQRSATLRAKL